MGFLTWALSITANAQCLSHRQFWDSVISIENSSKDIDQKLSVLSELKIQFENCNLDKDSVFARMLHRIGALEYQQGHFYDAIQNTIAAVRINTSRKAGACYSYVGVSYYNLGLSYNQLSRYNEVLLYFDSLDVVSEQFPQVKKFVSPSRLIKGNIYYKKGNFEKDVEETTLGLRTATQLNDTLNIIRLLGERSQAYEMQEKIDKALNDVNELLFLLQFGKSNDPDYESWANAYGYKANIMADQNNCAEALGLFKKAISFRTKMNNRSFIPQDYISAGYMLLYKCNNPSEAKKYFGVAYQISMEEKDYDIASSACNNLAQMNFNKGSYLNALKLYQQALQLLIPHDTLKILLNNPSYKELRNVEKKNFLETVLDNKSKSLLYLYKQTYKPEYLKCSVSTALLADSIITDLRHEQIAEQSKLYWSKDTRDFFTRTIEACYLNNNPVLAFYFLEKSRAVLLNDKLNELGAASKLPATEVAKQDKLQINIIEQQQKLSALNENSPEYSSQQINLLNAKDDFEHYIKSLEQEYPAFYQYKYADEIPSLTSLQDYLSKNNQSFVHYFIGDTVTYILAITPHKTKFMRLSKNEFDNSELTKFLRFCSDKNSMNNRYNSFAVLSNSIYKNLFQPLQIPKGRVIICLDNFLIPFEALCTDTNGKNFLVNDYSFSYVYAARYLLAKQNVNNNAKGNFLGIAPVSFSAYLNVADLTNSSTALGACAKNYSSNELLTEKDANRKNFFAQLPNYNIVNIFSHAYADSTDIEPRLFMQDSVIHLSELQLIQHPATKLVVLSACQTDVGKNATGEGIYSLARGFTAAGIPSVAATLWKADEQTIYAISESFNHNLSEGMNKDEALWQAKLSFIKNNNGNEKLLPYFWSNMILVGNTDPVKLSEKSNWWLWIAMPVALLIIALVIVLKRNK